MVEIMKGKCEPGGNSKVVNSKGRRKMKRMQEKWKRRNDKLSIASTFVGDQAILKVEKVLLLNTPRDDLVMPAEQKDDAIYHAVNHAHQRRPGKKWS